MQYGLHAVGLTAHTSRMLDQKDARYLRAITRCPSHLTHESTAELRRRVKVSSPLHALCRMLDKRAVRCASSDSRAEFALLRERLRQIDNGSAVCDGLTGALIEADACNPVACNICGQYFSNMRLMKSHRTRQHGKTPKPSMPDSLQYASHTVDGMPQCRHCLQMFTRVEGLKKHLRGSCRILHQASTTAVAAVSSGEVPPEREKLLGCSRRTSPAAVAPVPLLQQTAFRSQVGQNWKHALADPSLARALCNYCVICAQWVSHSGGIKQHIRLMHASEWTLKSEAAARCSSLGLVVESPYRYCTRPVKDPRAHLSHCMPVFQASLAALLVNCVQEHGASGQGDGRPTWRASRRWKSGELRRRSRHRRLRDRPQLDGSLHGRSRSRQIGSPSGRSPVSRVSPVGAARALTMARGATPTIRGRTTPRLWGRRRRSFFATWRRCSCDTSRRCAC